MVVFGSPNPAGEISAISVVSVAFDHQHRDAQMSISRITPSTVTDSRFEVLDRRELGSESRPA
jgi:hypothetical protein